MSASDEASSLGVTHWGLIHPDNKWDTKGSLLHVGPRRTHGDMRQTKVSRIDHATHPAVADTYAIPGAVISLSDAKQILDGRFVDPATGQLQPYRPLTNNCQHFVLYGLHELWSARVGAAVSDDTVEAVRKRASRVTGVSFWMHRRSGKGQSSELGRYLAKDIAEDSELQD